MRILAVNFGATPGVARVIAATAPAAAGQAAEIEAVSAPLGLPRSVTRADRPVAGPAMLAALVVWHGQHDAAVIACSGDPGLDAARDVLEVLVPGAWCLCLSLVPGACAWQREAGFCRAPVRHRGAAAEVGNCPARAAPRAAPIQ